MTMKDWAEHLDRILTMSGENLLAGNGRISHKQAIDKATTEYRKYKAKTLSAVEEDYRYVEFAVTGACKIEVYGMSGNSNSTRSLKLLDGSGTELITWGTVTGTELNYLTYSYTGGATTLRIGSGNSGVNLYGINIIYPTTRTSPSNPT